MDPTEALGLRWPAIRKVVTRIDLSFAMTLPAKGVTIRSMIEGNSLFIPDPCPPRKRRKPLYMVVHFRQGGRRAIMRPTETFLTKLKRPNIIISGRVEATPFAG